MDTMSQQSEFASLAYTFPAVLPESFKQYRGILLDIDGTLADTNLLHATTWHQALNAQGYPVTLAQVYHLIGKGADWLLPQLAGVAADSAAGQAVSEQQSTLFLQQLHTVSSFTGAREFVKMIRKDGFLVAVASSGSPEHVEAILRQIGLSDLLAPLPEHLIPDDSKPAPDILQQAAKQLAIPLHDCVMIGDTSYDQQAAQRAGCGFWPVHTNPVWGDQLQIIHPFK